MAVGQPYTAFGNVEADNSVITAGIGQLASDGMGAARGGADPSVFFEGDKFDACNLDKRLAFHPATVERVVFSGLVSKINKRGKRQERVFVCTNEAFYNWTPATGLKVLRRIPLHNIGRLCESQPFAVPNQGHQFLRLHLRGRQGYCRCFCVSGPSLRALGFDIEQRRI